jgi:hypothetical protein
MVKVCKLNAETMYEMQKTQSGWIPTTFENYDFNKLIIPLYHMDFDKKIKKYNMDIKSRHGYFTPFDDEIDYFEFTYYNNKPKHDGILLSTKELDILFKILAVITELKVLMDLNLIFWSITKSISDTNLSNNLRDCIDIYIIDLIRESEQKEDLSGNYKDFGEFLHSIVKNINKNT